MTNDGTQDPGPAPVLSDPLAGLVTGARYDPEPLRVRVVDPPLPDISAVREAMANVLDDDSELSIVPLPSTAGPGPDPRQADPPAGEVPERDAERTPAAEPPPAGPPVAPAGPSVAQAPVARVPTQVPVTRVPTPANIPAQRSAPPGAVPPARPSPPAVVAERTRRIRVPRGFTPREFRPPPGVKGRSSAGSVALIMALLLVIAVIAIVFLASLVETISSIFG